MNQASPASVPQAKLTIPQSVAPKTKASVPPMVWIVAGVLGVLGIGSTMVLLLVVGIVALVMLNSRSGARPPIATEARPARSESPVDSPSAAKGYADSVPAQNSFWRPTAEPAGALPNPGYTSEASQGAYEAPSDTQFNLPEYQRDAIRELNSR